MAPEATAAQVTVSLGLDSYADMAVDDAHGHLFFSQGGGKDGVLVTTMDGARVTMITGLPGAGLDLSADGTRLYVGLPTANAISVVDTQTLTEVERHSTGANTCPSDVAVAGSRVWYGYGCAGWTNEDGFGALDLSASPPVVRTWPDSDYYSAPILSVASGRLAVGEPGASPGIVSTYDISSGEPRTLVLGRDVGDHLNEIHLTPDGERVITASGVPYEHPVWRTDDMSAAGVYSSGSYPTSATTSADGSLVGIGTDSPLDPDVRVYRPGGVGPVRTWDFGEGTTLRLADRGLAFSADASRLFAVTTAPFSENPQLHVLDGPGVSGSTLTISLPPSPRPANRSR